MKALSIRQPWAWLIVHGYKDIENRDWRTNYTGPLLIHASKTFTKEDLLSCAAFCKKLGVHITRLGVLPTMMPRGGIIGMVEMTGCVDRSQSPWFEGRYGFEMQKPKLLQFIPFKGQLGFFEVEACLV